MFRTVSLSIIRSFSLYTQQWYMSDCSLAVSKPVWHIPLLCIQWKTPDDRERNCPKHVEFRPKNKFEKLVHLVGFVIRIQWAFFCKLSLKSKNRTVDPENLSLLLTIFFIAKLSRGITPQYCTSLWCHFVTFCDWQIFIERNSYLYTSLFSSILTDNSSTMTHLTKHWNKQKIFRYSFPFCVKTKWAPGVRCNFPPNLGLFPI